MEHPTRLTKSTGIIVAGSSNNPPIANAYISQGSNAYTDDALQVVVGWFDSDGDNLAGTEIRWFRDGYQVSAFNDLTWVTPMQLLRTKFGMQA